MLEKLVDNINSHKQLQAYWRVMNVNAIDRRGMTDHGHTHFQIVANVALRIMRLLKEHDVQMSITKDFDLDYDHAEAVVFLASLMHDLGMSIDREGHEEFSLIIAYDLLKDILGFMEPEKRIVVSSEVLHAIISHRSGGFPQTIEAGVLRVSDALDMSKGRSRIPYESGLIDIHSVSAAAIDNVTIKEGEKKPVSILIEMNNSAGIFQVDELLRRKLLGSGIEDYIEVKAVTPGRSEKSLITEHTIHPGEKRT